LTPDFHHTWIDDLRAVLRKIDDEDAQKLLDLLEIIEQTL